MKYFITYHAIERLKERFPVFYNKQPVLKDWKKEKGTACVKSLFDNWVEISEENKSYLNNSVYMLKLYDKYGYDAEYCFLELKQENILFVFTKNRSENHYRLVTLMPTEYRPSATNKSIKYNNKQTKEAKHTKFVMDLYDKLEASNKRVTQDIANEIKKDCSQEIKDKLQELVVTNQTNIISRISNSKAMHKVILDDHEYEFIYGKTNNGSREIIIESIKSLSSESLINKRLQSYITPELKKSLLATVYQGITTAEKISNSKSIHKIDLNGMHYHFICQKKSSGDRDVILQEEPYAVSNIKKFKM